MRITALKIEHVTEYQRAAATDAQGYSVKMPTDYKVKTDHGGHWKRIYCYQVSNAGTLFFNTREGRQSLTTQQQAQLEELRDHQEHPTTYAQRWTEAANRAHAMQRSAAAAVEVAEDAPPALAQELTRLRDATATADATQHPALIYIDDWQDIEARARVLLSNARQHAPQTARGAQHAAILNYCRQHGDRQTLLDFLQLHRASHREPLAEAAEAADRIRAKAYELEPTDNADPTHPAVSLQDAAKAYREELKALAARHA